MLFPLIYYNQCNNRDTYDPRNDRALKKICFKKLCKANQDSTPDLQGCNETPYFLEFLVVIGRIKMEFREYHKRSN